MRFADYVRIAMSNLWKRKLRTVLTIFAVVIGATLVGLMVSLGVGLQNYVTGQLTALSVPDVIGVEPEANLGLASVLLGATGLGAPQEVEEGQAYPYLDIGTLTGEDVERIRAVEHVDAVEPVVFVMSRWVQLEGDEKKYQAQILSSPIYEIEQRKLDAGRAFEPGERGVLRRKPRPPQERIFDRLMIERTIIGALVMGGVVFGVFAWLLSNGWSEAGARNVILLLMVLFQIIHIGNCIYSMITCQIYH